MHTFMGKEGTRFHYNQDLSGDVIILKGEEELNIPASDLLEFVSNHIANLQIAQIEKNRMNIYSQVGLGGWYGTKMVDERPRRNTKRSW